MAQGNQKLFFNIFSLGRFWDHTVLHLGCIDLLESELHDNRFDWLLIGYFETEKLRLNLTTGKTFFVRTIPTCPGKIRRYPMAIRIKSSRIQIMSFNFKFDVEVVLLFVSAHQWIPWGNNSRSDPRTAVKLSKTSKGMIFCPWRYQVVKFELLGQIKSDLEWAADNL